jgi:hypothetical protein
MMLAYSEQHPAELGMEIGEALDNGASYVHVAEMPFATLPETERDTFITEVSSSVGAMTLTGAMEGTELWQLNSATSPNAEYIPFHTDNPFYNEPEAVVAFWNLRSSPKGGENIILPVRNMLGWMATRSEYDELLTELSTTQVPFTLKDAAATGVMLDTNAQTARYDQKYISDAQAKLGLQLRNVADAAAESVAERVKLAPGDALFFNNHSVLHARAPYSDPNRLSIRTRMHRREL